MIGVILHYYGSPETLADAKQFYARILHRTPTEEEVERLVAAYRSYGRPGPLGATVERIQWLLEERLNDAGDRRFIVRKAGKHSAGTVADIVASMKEEGARHFVSLPLTPFGSRLGSDNYHRAVRRAVGEEAGGTVLSVDRWYLNKTFVRACSLRLAQAWQWLPEPLRDGAEVVFTIHSMPREEKQAGLSLHEQYELWARETAKQARIPRWSLSYRSAPGSDEHWLGPDVLDVIADVAKRGRRAIVVCPLPTLVENVEVFQEAGTDAQTVAQNLGLEFVRTELLNDSADMLDVLEELIEKALAAALDVSGEGKMFSGEGKLKK